MAVITIPDGCWKQSTRTQGEDETGNRTLTVQIKGTASALRTLTAGWTRGETEVETGWVAKSWQHLGGPGGSATLTVTCSPKTEQTEEETPTDKALKVVWKCRAVRNDVSLMGYCNGADPERCDIEMWLKETDPDLASTYQYRTPDGQVHQLGGPGEELAKKFAKGIESVMRFYPVITCVATYNECPPAMLENLSYIDTPSAPPAIQAFAPKNLQTVINLHEWVRCQDDSDETADGKWTRTISWMGILKTDANNGHPWDADLYGTNRWTMPYGATADNPGTPS